MDIALLVLLGLVAGVISALCGVGGGVIVVPALMWLKGLDVKLAIGTSLAFIIPTALAGALKKPAEQVDCKVAAIVASGAVGGAFVGVWLGNEMSAFWVKRCFAVLLLVVAARLFFE